MFVLFDKNKNFIGYSEDIPSLPTLNILKLKLPKEKEDISKWKWDGNMITGKMIPINLSK
jgi:hypothetical protein